MIMTVWIELINFLFFLFLQPPLHACRNTLLDAAASTCCTAEVEGTEKAALCGHCLNLTRAKETKPSELLCLVSPTFHKAELVGNSEPIRNRRQLPHYKEHEGECLPPPWLPPDPYIFKPARMGARIWLHRQDLLNVHSPFAAFQLQSLPLVRLFPPVYHRYNKFHFVIPEFLSVSRFQPPGSSCYEVSNPGGIVEVPT